ncbi:MAG TPA: STAS domain-containing protein [bacterium]|jgi:anti-sigma B factor antagonist|nr:STAS domain-containing protein [bacterium]HPG83898.1 STAS domain-containing protein [bacterium]
MENFKVVRLDGVNLTTLKIIGFLDAHTAPTLEEAIQKLLDEEQVNILVDFKELSYISSAGLGVFMGFIEEIRSKNGDIKMCAMSPKIYRVFDLLGFPTIYQIFDKQEEALATFPQNSAASSSE